MTMSDEDVRFECDAALADAGLAPDQIRFFQLSELRTGNIGAAWFRPHTDIEPGDPHFPGDDAQRAEANSDENRNCTGSPFRPSPMIACYSQRSFGTNLSTPVNGTPGRSSLISKASSRTTSSRRSRVASTAAEAG